MYVVGPPKTSTHQAADVGAVLLAHAAREEAGQQVVALDPVVERVDHPAEGCLAARPLEQRGHRVDHAATLATSARPNHGRPTMASMYAVQLAFSDDPARLEHRPAHRERLAAPGRRGPAAGRRPVERRVGRAARLPRRQPRRTSTRSWPRTPTTRRPGVTVAGVHEWNPVTRHPALDRSLTRARPRGRLHDCRRSWVRETATLGGVPCPRTHQPPPDGRQPASGR